MKLRAVPIVVAAALITGCGSTFTSPPTATTDSPMERPSTATASPGAVADSLHIAWSEVPFEGSVGAMAGDGSRFVAVGSVSDGATSWTSSDGITWEHHEVPAQSLGEIDPGVDLTAGMGRLIRLGDTLYSFGGAAFNDAVLFAAWRWTDGGAWEIIESESEFFADGRVTAVTASDEALLAVRISFAGGLRGAYSTWLWNTNTSWVETGLASSDDEDIRVQDVAWDAGSYVAVGDRAERRDDTYVDEWPRTSAIWESPDGRDWTLIQPPEGMSSVSSVAALPTRGFVALGTVGERLATWISLRGDEWVEGTIEPPTAPAPIPRVELGWPYRIVALNGGLLAAAGTEGGTLTWTSIDGRFWAFGERLDISGWQPANLAALGNHVLLFGYRVDPQAENGFRQALLRGTAES